MIAPKLPNSPMLLLGATEPIGEGKDRIGLCLKALYILAYKLN